MVSSRLVAALWLHAACCPPQKEAPSTKVQSSTDLRSKLLLLFSSVPRPPHPLLSFLLHPHLPSFPAPAMTALDPQGPHIHISCYRLCMLLPTFRSLLCRAHKSQLSRRCGAWQLLSPSSCDRQRNQGIESSGALLKITGHGAVVRAELWCHRTYEVQRHPNSQPPHLLEFSLVVACHVSSPFHSFLQHSGSCLVPLKPCLGCGISPWDSYPLFSSHWLLPRPLSCLLQ